MQSRIDTLKTIMRAADQHPTTTQAQIADVFADLKAADAKALADSFIGVKVARSKKHAVETVEHKVFQVQQSTLRSREILSFS